MMDSQDLESAAQLNSTITSARSRSIDLRDKMMATDSSFANQEIADKIKSLYDERRVREEDQLYGATLSKDANLAQARQGATNQGK